MVSLSIYIYYWGAKERFVQEAQPACGEPGTWTMEGRNGSGLNTVHQLHCTSKYQTGLHTTTDLTPRVQQHTTKENEKASIATRNTIVNDESRKGEE